MQQAHCCALPCIPSEESLQQVQSAVTHSPQWQACSGRQSFLQEPVPPSTQLTDCYGAAVPAQIKAQRHRDSAHLQRRQRQHILKPPWRMTGPPWSTQQACLAAVLACSRLAAAEVLQRSAEEPFHWTAPTVVLAVALFLIAGLCEIGGGWLVWQVAKTPSSRLLCQAGRASLWASGTLHTALSLMLGLNCLILRVRLTTGQT